MSRKALAVILAAGLVAGLMAAPADAQRKKKKKKKPPVPVELQYFFRGQGCDDATFALSLEDGEDTSCWFTRSGIVYEAQLAAGDDPRTLGQTFPAADGVPFVLDTSKPITAEITTSSFTCLSSALPCSPAGIGMGQPTVEVTLLGMVGEEEKELGTHSETFTVAPGQQHTTVLELEIDPEHKRVTFDALSVHIFTHGFSFAHGIIEMEDPASFIVVPTLQPAK